LKVANDPAVYRIHPWDLGVGNLHDLNRQVILPLVVEEQRFSDAVTLVVTGRSPDGFYFFPLRLELRVHLRVAIDFRLRCLQDRSFESLCEAQHVDGPHYTRLRRLHRIALVVNRRRGTGKIENLIYFDIQGKSHIMSQELKLGICHQVVNVAFASSVKIIGAEDFMTLINQALRQM